MNAGQIRRQVALAVLAMFAAVLPSAAAAGQEQVPKKGEPAPAMKEITGTIASVDDSCDSFVLVSKAREGKKETILWRNAKLGQWLREPLGCIVKFSTGDELLLSAGLRVTVRYAVQGEKNLVSGIGAVRESQPDPCASQEGPAGKVSRAGCGGLGQPTCISCPTPPYTPQARDAHVQGIVILEVVILPDGRPSEVRVIRGLGMGLDESAVNTARKWRFKPFIGPQGTPVAVAFNVEVNFHFVP
jgi:TonB family protein